MQQVTAGIRTQHHIRILRPVCACLHAALQCQTNGISQIVLALCVGLRQSAQQFQQRLGAEPVCAGIDLTHLTLCLGGVLFLNDGGNAVFATQNSAVAPGLIQFCGDDGNGVLLLLMQTQRTGDGVAVHKRRIAAEHQRIAVCELLHKLLRLHHSVTGSQLLRLERCAVPVVQIQLYILRLIARDHTDAAQSGLFTGTDDPAQHRGVQHFQHRLRQGSLHALAVSAGKNNHLIHDTCPPISRSSRIDRMLDFCAAGDRRGYPFLYYDKILTLLQVFSQIFFWHCDFCITCQKNRGIIFLKNV